MLVLELKIMLYKFFKCFGSDVDILTANRGVSDIPLGEVVF